MSTATPEEPQLLAARNEFESFQIVIQAGPVNLKNVNVTVSAPLTGPATIPESNIVIYREEYYSVVAGKVSGPDGGSGNWPDALVPATDRWNKNAPLRTFLINTVPVGKNCVVWVDVLVPKNAAPGVYNGSIAVTATNDVTATPFNATVPINLTVFNAELPSTTRLKSAFLMGNEDISYSIYGSSQAGTGNEEEIWMLNARMAELALDNRITICNSWYQPLKAGNKNSSKITPCL